MRHPLVALLLAAAVAPTTAAAFRASATPVGPLPPGPETTVVAQTGQLVAVALPHRSGGRAWRIARGFDGTILHEVLEGDVGSNVVLVFKTTRAGKVTLAFALTRGETAKALEARSFHVQVR